jgi:ubiquinone/menaquinone biosynthesis C-methylase UbiE
MRVLRFLLFLALIVWAVATAGLWLWLRERYGRGGPMPVSQAGMLVHPLRSWFQPPGDTLALFGLSPGQTVLEVGTGAGYFTPEAARLVGPFGRVLSVDVQPEMLTLARLRLSRNGGSRAHTVAADAARLPLAQRSIDRAFFVDAFGEVADRPAALAEIRRVLKPAGTVSFQELPVDPDYVFEGVLTDLLTAAGFELVEHHRHAIGYTMTFAAPS